MNSLRIRCQLYLYNIIIIKSKAYDEIYRNQLQEDFSLNNEELDAYIFGYDEKHLNRILSKFNMDIMNEFKNNEK